MRVAQDKVADLILSKRQQETRDYSPPPTLALWPQRAPGTQREFIKDGGGEENASGGPLQRSSQVRQLTLQKVGIFTAGSAVRGDSWKGPDLPVRRAHGRGGSLAP